MNDRRKCSGKTLRNKYLASKFALAGILVQTGKVTCLTHTIPSSTNIQYAVSTRYTFLGKLRASINRYAFTNIQL